MLTIYSKTICPYCVTAKSFLSGKGIEYHEINVERDPKAREFLTSHGHRTVPQIYYEDYTHENPRLFVEGGCTSLIKLSHEELKTKLAQE